MKIITPALVTILMISLIAACSKQEEWLDKKATKADAVPETIEEFQGILDNGNVMNQSFPTFSSISSDNFFVTFASWQSRTNVERNLYIWAPDIYEGGSAFDWNMMYRMIFHANVVIEGIKKIPVINTNKTPWNEAMGAALFYRAYGHLNLLQLFSPAYDSASAGSDLGIPLKLNSNVNDRPPRSSVRDSYQQVINDLNQALSLLPETPRFQNRPSRPAANALLARTFLFMKNYQQALSHANEALASYNTLINFNTLNTAAPRPFPAFPGNKEIIFYAESTVFSIVSQANFFVDTLLFQSYHNNDLRKNAFFGTGAGGYPTFKGTYTAKNGFFAGIASNELYLISAEAKARLGNANTAMDDLNFLLQSRFKTGTFVPYTATSPGQALSIILSERRKELPFYGTIRWSDLKRLNTESQFAITLTRVLNNTTYTLQPNHERYVLPIPEDEIKLSGIQQNPR